MHGVLKKKKTATFDLIFESIFLLLFFLLYDHFDSKFSVDFFFLLSCASSL